MSAFWPRLKKALILLAIPAALALPLVFLLEDFVRDAIVTPLAYQAWLIGVVVDALPHGCLLAAVLAVGTYLAVRSLGRVKTGAWQQSRPPKTSTGSVTAWLKRFDLLMRGSYTRARFDHHVGLFLLRVVAHDRRMSPRDLVRGMEMGDIAVPAEISRYAEAVLHGGRLHRRHRLAWLQPLIFWRRREQVSLREVENRLESALLYTESQLRISIPEEHDGQSAPDAS